MYYHTKLMQFAISLSITVFVSNVFKYNIYIRPIIRQKKTLTHCFFFDCAILREKIEKITNLMGQVFKNSTYFNRND